MCKSLISKEQAQTILAKYPTDRKELSKRIRAANRLHINRFVDKRAKRIQIISVGLLELPSDSLSEIRSAAATYKKAVKDNRNYLEAGGKLEELYIQKVLGTIKDDVVVDADIICAAVL